MYSESQLDVVSEALSLLGVMVVRVWKVVRLDEGRMKVLALVSLVGDVRVLMERGVLLGR